MSSLALRADQIPNIGTGLLIGIVVVGLLLAIVITSLIGRVIVAVVVIALGVYVWQQRTVIQNRITSDKCQLDTTFFGIHVKAPPQVVQACLKKTQSIGR